MKTRFIVASSIGLLGVTSMILGATTFAANTGASKIMNFGSGTKMMGNRDGMMKQFTNTGEVQAFRTAVETATEKKDYTAFVAAHTKYGITKYSTEAEFNEMIARKATQEKIQAALEDGDYATRKTLSVGHPILETINTEAKFKKFQEMHVYQEKIRVIAEELGLPGPTGKGMGMGMKEGPRGMGQGQGKGMGMGMHK